MTLVGQSSGRIAGEFKFYTGDAWEDRLRAAMKKAAPCGAA